VTCFTAILSRIKVKVGGVVLPGVCLPGGEKISEARTKITIMESINNGGIKSGIIIS
jgi:hypothetical protein